MMPIVDKKSDYQQENVHKNYLIGSEYLTTLRSIYYVLHGFLTLYIRSACDIYVLPASSLLSKLGGQHCSSK